MSSVSAACIFGAYSASSAHTDTFYIVPQIIRVRNSKRHFFSKLTFPYIIQPLRLTLRQHRPQPLRLHPTATSTTAALPRPTVISTIIAPPHPTVISTTTALLSPYGNIDHNRLAFALRSHRPQPPCFHPTATSTTAALLSPYGNIDHNCSASPYGNIDHSRSASPYGNIDHNRLAFTLRPHRPQPLRLHPTVTSTTTRHFAQQSRLNSSAEKNSYFFKKALDKYPKTVYNVYCYLGVAQIGSALPWGGRGRRFKSCHSDQLKTA